LKELENMAIARQRIHLPPGAWRRALTTWLRGRLWEGDAIDRFEKAFAEFIGAPAAVVVPSGRAGLLFTLDALDLPKGSDVICASFAYPVVPHIAHTLGHKVRYAEIELETLGMDPDALAATIREDTKLVIATHLYGVPCRIREIREVAEAHGAILIEDCAHCFGASAGGVSAGAFGTYGYFSFETSKPVNTMGGGIVTVADPELAERVRATARKQSPNGPKWLARRLLKTSFESLVTNPLLFNLGVYPALRLMSKEGGDDRFASGYQADEVTLTGRMGRYTNYQAVLGLDQMQKTAPAVARRVANAERLMARAGDGVHFQRSRDPEVRSNYMLMTALVPEIQTVTHRLLARGVDTKYLYMRDCSGIGDAGESFPLAARAEREVLHIPAYPELSDRQIDHAADSLREVVAEVSFD
jgi:dTDP-4-amino-4,6-dideoxygalactose transaminase